LRRHPASPFWPNEHVDIPFGGYKFSGIGRQNGEAGFNQYLETKSIAWPIPKQ